MTMLSKTQLGNTETRIVSMARNLASKIGEDTKVSALVSEAMEATIARAVRPLLICFALSELLGDEMDNLPKVGSKDGNNPDKYIKGYNKKTNEAQWGSFYDWYVEYLPVFQPHAQAAIAIKEAKKKDGSIPKGFEHFGTMGDTELSAEAKTIQARRTAAKTEIVKAIQVYQMAELLAEFETVEVRFEQMADKDGNETLNTRTRNPITLLERFAKRNDKGDIVKDTEGDVVWVHTGKAMRLSVNEFINLDPHHAATMDGGFSFENLKKAARDAAEQRKQADQAAIRDSMVQKPENWFTAVEDVLAYVNIDAGSDDDKAKAAERHLMHIRQVMDKDETRMAQVMQLALVLDILYDEYKDRYHRYNKEQRNAADAADKKQVAA
jgi:hypothetical protein